MKPRLYRQNGMWWCWGWNGEDLGYGVTPAAAYQDCLAISMARYNFA